jgi:hypothetical protein
MRADFLELKHYCVGEKIDFFYMFPQEKTLKQSYRKVIFGLMLEIII